jgi:hypothetical protein
MNAMENPDTRPAAVIPQPLVYPVPDITIAEGHEYPPEAWDEATEAIRLAEVQVLAAREVKRLADVAYEAALAARIAAQVPRDLMIATDRRTPAAVARLCTVGRARVSVIRRTIRPTLTTLLPPPSE